MRDHPAKMLTLCERSEWGRSIDPERAEDCVKRFEGWLTGVLISIPATLWLQQVVRAHWVYYFPFSFAIAFSVGWLVSACIPASAPPAASDSHFGASPSVSVIPSEARDLQIQENAGDSSLRSE